MMKTALHKPLFIALYGFPGSGKSYVARNLAETLKIARVSEDRIRGELFEQPRHDKHENTVITHLMDYMAGEFLSAGISVVYDVNALRMSHRRVLRDLARKHHAEPLLIWIQTDAETSFTRTQDRDRRTSDDKFAREHTRASFNELLSHMQNPQHEDYIVVSGKHTFDTQRNAIINRLYQLGLVDVESLSKTVAKPGLVNLVPKLNGGRVDMSRRNIVIR